MKFDHPRLLVANFPECFRFYRDLMELKVTWGDENDSYGSFTDREGKESVLALFNRQAMAEVVGTNDLPLDASAQDRVALIFTVDDVDSTVEQLKSQSVSIVLEPRDYPDWGIRSAYLRDPDGHLIEISGELSPEHWSDGLKEASQNNKRG
jgi:catechol 2,3-dioxygenase-like lactoylglutathione lyase family enzyme